MDPQTERRVLGLIGLGVRGRLAVVGVEQVREAVKKGSVLLAVVASDVSRHSHDKVVPLLRAKGVRVIEVASAATLGRAVGREATAVVGVTDHHLAKGIRGVIDTESPAGDGTGDSDRRTV